MGIFKGGALRLLQSFLYLLAFCCAAIILGLYSYFLSLLADRDYVINNYLRAVEGISGAAVVYTIFAVVLTCCLGGITFFAFLGILIDICFVGAFIAVAYFTREGAYSCSGFLNTPIGLGPADSKLPSENANGNHYITYGVKLGTACRMNKACFAVSIVAIFIFLVTAIMQVALIRHHKKEKRFGPSPSNGYTSGSGKKKGLFARKNKNDHHDAEMAAAGGAAAGGLAAHHHHDTRPSHETGYTGTTVGGTNAIGQDKVAEPTGAHTGYYNQPTTGAANPYGYNTTTNTTTTTGTATNY